MAIDKKSKKRLVVLRAKLDKLQQQLRGAKSQADDPGEVGRRQAEIDAVLAEMHKLKGS